MSFIGEAKSEINFKIVYYGVGLSGRSTNLQYIHSRIEPDFRSQMFSLATETERTLFFDFVPRTLGPVDGRQPRIHLYAVPGSVFYAASHRQILAGVDGVVFVVDSQRERLEGNLGSFEDLHENLKSHGLAFRHQGGSVPLVLQYNKRDLPNAAPVAELDRQLNLHDLPRVEAVAHLGTGVFDTLRAVAHLIVR